jgi:hypothetical protein
VAVRLGTGATERFGLRVGSDGYRSSVRAPLRPGSTPDYAGYTLWRGVKRESRPRGPALLEQTGGRAAYATSTVVIVHGVD